MSPRNSNNRREQNILSIAITPDFSGEAAASSRPACSSHDAAGLLSPHSTTGQERPLSNRSSDHDRGFVTLRDSGLESPTGIPSVRLLPPMGHPTGGNNLHRQDNGPSTSNEATAADHLHHDFETLRHVDTYSFSVVDEKQDYGEIGLTRNRTGFYDDVDPAPFAFTPSELAMMLERKDLVALAQLGGSNGLLRGLGTNSRRGLRSAWPRQHDNETVPTISRTEPEDQDNRSAGGEGDRSPAFSASLDERRRIYGANVFLPTRTSKPLLLSITWRWLMHNILVYNVMILLFAAAAISFALSLYQDFGPSRHSLEPSLDWVEGVAIMIAIFIMEAVHQLEYWQADCQFMDFVDKQEDRGVKVIRDGVESVVNAKELVVGDIALLEPGEIVPCDGVFLGGHNLRCDESYMTGMSDAIKKVSFEECVALRQRTQHIGGNAANSHADCFVVSGSKVLHGVGRYVLVAVGTKSFKGRIRMALYTETKDMDTPLQRKLTHVGHLISKMQRAAGLILFTVLTIRFFVQLGTGSPPRTANEKGISFINILIISVTLIVTAFPAGLYLTATFALGFATKQMTYENLLVQVPESCETAANMTVVCTNKTSSLTQNDMVVVAGSVGIYAKFFHHKGNQIRINANQLLKPGTGVHVHDFFLDHAHMNDVISPPLCNLFNKAITINSTALQDTDAETGEVVFIGDKTEMALLKFAKELGWTDLKTTRDSVQIVQMIPFSSERKAMGVVVELPDRRFRLYLKGASEILAKKCSHHVVVHKKGNGTVKEQIETSPIDELTMDNISRTIIFYANQSLHTLVLCYRDFHSWNQVKNDDFVRDLTLIGIMAIKNPLRDGARNAVTKCRKAGVAVKMCTSDNALTARSIATQCGIFTAGGIIMEGPIFRELTRSDMIEIVPRLQVLARSSPDDKKILIKTLRSIGEVVGVTGKATSDGPALKSANVGFAMGIAGTDVAKEASDIILMGDNFSSAIKAILWGRCVNDAARKYLQFRMTTNVTALVITFVSAVASHTPLSALSTVQVFWIAIIADTFAVFAFATDPAPEVLLDRKSDTASIFSVDMCKQIFFQSTYQITIILVFHFAGLQILGFQSSSDKSQTLSFNIFIFTQIFNSVNCRRLDKKLNIFEGFFRNWYFIIITLVEAALQVLIVFVGGAAFKVMPIARREWVISLALGVVSIPLGALIRLIPNGPFEYILNTIGVLERPELIATDTSTGNTAQPRPCSNPAQFDPPQSSVTLWQDKVHLHPDTSPDDPAYIRFGGWHNLSASDGILDAVGKLSANDPD